LTRKKQTVTLQVDPNMDALYLQLNELQIIESEEVHPGVGLGFNAEEQVTGIEILRAQRPVPLVDLKQIQFQVV
jgi:uncharacterized protein YuzE